MPIPGSCYIYTDPGVSPGGGGGGGGGGGHKTGIGRGETGGISQASQS